VVGTHKEFKERIDRSRDQLLDVASSTLGSKTIADLEKPGARNLIRTELITVFNNALGDGVIEEIYITEMAIQ
jgi:flagellar FliL protein